MYWEKSFHDKGGGECKRSDVKKWREEHINSNKINKKPKNSDTSNKESHMLYPALVKQTSSRGNLHRYECVVIFM